MRPSLIPGLVMAAQRNADRGIADVALFEVGQIFKGDKPEDQLTAATGLRRALAKASGIGRHWSSAAKPVDAFDAKADAFAVLAAAGAPMQALQVVPGGPAWFHPGRSAAPSRSGRRTCSAYFGELHPRALAALQGGRAAGGVRSDPGKNPRAEGQADAGQAPARTVAVPAGGARFRLRGRRAA